MNDVFAKLLDFLTPEKKISVPKLGVFIILLIITMPIALNYFYENIKTEQEIRILNQLIEIDRNDIDDPRLLEYYNSILDSLNKKNVSIIKTINDKPEKLSEYFLQRNIYKFISGSIWCILFFIACIFAKQETISTKIMLLIIMLILIFLFGLAGVHIPSFSLFAINIIGFPLIQLLIIIFIFRIYKKVKQKKIKTRM